MAEITEKMAKMTFNQSPEAKAHYDGLIAYEQHGHIIAPEVGQEYWIPVQGGHYAQVYGRWVFTAKGSRFRIL